MSQMIVNGLKVEVARKIIRNFHLHVRPSSGEVKVSAPFFVSEEAIRTMILRKFAWIQRHLQRPKRAVAVPAPKLRYLSGETHLFLGNAYFLQVTPHSGRPRVIQHDAATVKTLELQIAAGSTLAQRQQVLERWYRRQLQAVVEPLIPLWQHRMGVEIAEWYIKKMKTRWGTCNPRDRRIWLALELAKKPVAQIEYVLVHEMVHFFEPSHNARFKALMDRYLPGWRLLRAELNGKGAANTPGC